jgi:2-octaprenyl-6-methoxyphenol hydroxylase
MNVCLIGNGISTLILANVLANRNIKVSIYQEVQPKKKLITRTLGISKNNFNYLIKEKINIQRKSWPVNKIKIFNEIENSKEILNFGSKSDKIFYIIKYRDLINLLYTRIKQNKVVKQHKIENSSFFNSILKEEDNYDLIINFNEKNKISKKLFFKRNEKDYNSLAFTSLIDHERCKNNIAHQIFTKFGPLAFLPCSNNKTSIVFSILDQNNIIPDHKIKELILNYNKKYKIKSFTKFEKFKLKSSILKNYYHKKILCFGDNLHKIHPLAGQGLNMTIRDIKILLNLIDFRINLGLPLDNSILVDFQNKTKHYNYIFSNAIDFIHEFFKFDNNFGNLYSKKLFNFLEANSLFKKYTTKFADKGIFFNY